MAQNRIDKMEERQMEEAWEMNMHMNPIDSETEETIKRHKAILTHHSDDFVAYIHHVENARLAEIAKRFHEEKLMDFAKVEDPDYDVSFQKSTTRTGSHALRESNHNQANAIDDEIREAIDIEDADKVTDLKEFAKTSQTVKNDPNRFTCVLGKFANKQPSQKRLYLQALPHYIEEKQKAREIAIQQSLKKGQSSKEPFSVYEFEDNNNKQKSNQVFTPEQINKMAEKLCPPRRLDTALDPEKQKKAYQRNMEYKKMFVQMRSQKKQYLDRLNASEVYRTTKVVPSVNSLSPSQAYQQRYTKYQFCSSGNKESSSHMNTEMVRRDIVSRKQSFTNTQSGFYAAEIKRSKSNLNPSVQKRVLRNTSNLNSGYLTQMNSSQLGTARLQGQNSKSQLGYYDRKSTSRNTAAGLGRLSKGQSAATLNLMNSPSIKTEINMARINNNQSAQGNQPFLISEPSAQMFQFKSNLSSRQIPVSNRPYGHSSGYGNFAGSRQNSNMKIKNVSIPPNGFVTQSRWISIKPDNLNDDNDNFDDSVDSYAQEQVQNFQLEEQDRRQNSTAISRSTLVNKQSLIDKIEYSKQKQVQKPYNGLNRAYLDRFQDSATKQSTDRQLPVMRNDHSIPQINKSNITFAKMQLKASSYQEPDFKVVYELKIPDALKSRVNRAYETFTKDVLREVEPVSKLPIGEYQGAVSKGSRQGLGMMRMENGDLYKGNFKNGVRSGVGFCKFKSGALYKGDWRDDKPHGPGILYSGKNEILECRFEAGAVPQNGRVKIMLQDGSYYEGGYSNHKRHGQGTCYYNNGEMFEGQWNNDKRISRGKMRFLNGTFYHGQFILDKADGSGQIEDKDGNFFQAEQGEEEDGKDSGCIINGRLQHRCSVTFANGDKFIGIFKDGRPNGYGQIHYKNSIKGTGGSEFEQAQYHGEFRQGKRDGKGKMIWADGTIFEGIWKNDKRHHGRQIMSNGWIYKGSFKNDKFDGPNEKVMMANMVIYQGKVIQNKTTPLSLLLYPSGDIYYGQHAQFIKHGVGKLIKHSGGFYECSWDNDKYTGKNTRIYDDQTGDLFVGTLEDGKKTGKGRLYDAERDEVYEGDFENDKRQGEGIIYKRNGEVFKGDFRQNFMEGPVDLVATYNKAQIDQVFKNAHSEGNFYVTVNKQNQSKVREMLQQTANLSNITNGFQFLARKPQIVIN